ncbi:hypothetical protein C8R46DRAFT_1341712 [Mycena filopes]|nr:hypothetical protein C8R46DRAFT_1341712 [Mycena filopes]
MATPSIEPSAAPEPRYIYYRIYLLDGLIASKSCFSPSDPFTGRILASSLSPPHNEKTLRRCLAGAEGFNDPGELFSELYGVLNGPEFSDTPDGANLQTPYTFIFKRELSTNEMETRAKMAQHGQHPRDFWCYHLYTRVAEDASRVPFNSSRPAMGHIPKALVTPPLSRESFLRSIAKAEGKPIYAFGDLYQDISALAPMISLPQENNSNFGTSEKPMVLVQPERCVDLHNRGYRPLALKVLSERLPSKGLRRKDGTRATVEGWLDRVVPADTIVYTDGIPRTCRHPTALYGYANVYQVVYDGGIGYIFQEGTRFPTRFLDE